MSGSFLGSGWASGCSGSSNIGGEVVTIDFDDADVD